MKKCPYCAENIQEAAIVCKHCGRDLNKVPKSPENQSYSVIPICELCGGEMKKSSESTFGLGASLVVILGFMLLFVFPIGTIIGVILIVVGLNSFTKRKGLWVCKKCSHQVERKIAWYELG